MRIGVVSGDDVLGRIPGWIADGVDLAHLETGAPIASMAWATHSTAGHQEPSNQAKIAVGQAGTRVAPDHYFTGSEEAEPPPLTCSTSRWATSRSL